MTEDCRTATKLNTITQTALSGEQQRRRFWEGGRGGKEGKEEEREKRVEEGRERGGREEEGETRVGGWEEG